MGAGGDFRDDAAKILEEVDLRDDDVREEAIMSAIIDSYCSFIAGRFDSEDVHWIYIIP